MKYTIFSKKLGKEVTFSRPGRSHIFVDLNGECGTLGRQICRGGELMGSCISIESDNQRAFERTCKSWFTQYLKKHHAPQSWAMD